MAPEPENLTIEHFMVLNPDYYPDSATFSNVLFPALDDVVRYAIFFSVSLKVSILLTTRSHLALW